MQSTLGSRRSFIAAAGVFIASTALRAAPNKFEKTKGPQIYKNLKSIITKHF